MADDAEKTASSGGFGLAAVQGGDWAAAVTAGVGEWQSSDACVLAAAQTL